MTAAIGRTTRRGPYRFLVSTTACAKDVRRHGKPKLAGQDRRRHPEPPRRPHSRDPARKPVPVRVGSHPQDGQNIPGGPEAV